MNIKKNILLDNGFFLYISFASVTTLIILDGYYFIQLSEIIFLLILPFSANLIKNIKFTRIDILFFLYVLIFLINCLFHFEKTVLLESIGVIYLFSLFFLLSRFLSKMENLEEFLRKSFVGLLVVSCVTAVLGFLLSEMGITGRFIVAFENYPYLGKIIKLSGFSWCNLLLSNICLCLFFIVILPIRKKWKTVLSLLGICIAFLTFSKEFVLFAFLYSILILYVTTENNLLKRTFPISIGIIAIFMISFSFYVVKPVNLTKESMNLANMDGIGDKPHFQVFNAEFYPTVYFFLFKGAITLIKENPIKGIGSGNFEEELDKLKAKGKYPKKMTTYETHDFYWGQLSELGLIYLLFLAFLFHEVYSIFQNRNNIIPKEIHFTIVIILAFFLISFLVGGTKHYRHFWIFWAIINSFYIKHRSSTSKKTPQLI